MSGLPHAPPARKTKKPSASAAARLILQRGTAVKDESLDLFSALWTCQPDLHDAEERGAAAGMARRGGSFDELLSSEIGKHDYDWLLAPPATALQSSMAPAASKGLRRARSVSAAKSTSRLSPTHRENKNCTVSPARSSSVTLSSGSATSASSGHLLNIRISSSSVVTPSSAIPNSKHLAPATPRPRAPSRPRSAAVATSLHRPVKPRQVSGSVAGQSKGLLHSGSSTPSPRPRATSTDSSPRSTVPVSHATSRQTTPIRRTTVAPAKTRSNSAKRASTTGSRSAGLTLSTASPAPQLRYTAPGEVNLAEITHEMPSDSKARAVSTAGEQWRMAAASTTRRQASPVVTTAPSTRREDTAKTRLKGESRKINMQKVTARRVVLNSHHTRTGSTKSADADARRMESSRSWASRSSLGGKSISENGESSAAGTTRRDKLDAFPSARYDAPLLREDPKNLTWLCGCGGENAGDAGMESSPQQLGM